MTGEFRTTYERIDYESWRVNVQ